MHVFGEDGQEGGDGVEGVGEGGAGGGLRGHVYLCPSSGFG